MNLSMTVVIHLIFDLPIYKIFFFFYAGATFLKLYALKSFFDELLRKNTNILYHFLIFNFGTLLE